MSTQSRNESASCREKEKNGSLRDPEKDRGLRCNHSQQENARLEQKMIDSIALAESGVEEIVNMETERRSAGSDSESIECGCLSLPGCLTDYEFYHMPNGQTRILGANGFETVEKIDSISFDHEFVRTTEIQFENA